MKPVLASIVLPVALGALLASCGPSISAQRQAFRERLRGLYPPSAMGLTVARVSLDSGDVAWKRALAVLPTLRHGPLKDSSETVVEYEYPAIGDDVRRYVRVSRAGNANLLGLEVTTFNITVEIRSTLGGHAYDEEREVAHFVATGERFVAE